jgi:acetyl-CoA carboxylase biotin carboxyl carrier protein
VTIKEIRELLELFNESGVGELEVERAESRVRIVKARSEHEVVVAPPLTHHAAAAPVSIPAAPAPVAPPAAAPPRVAEPENQVLVKSPIVGTYYEAPSPGAAAFVKVGDVVEPGQVLCIIESMKLMNEIETEVGGTVIARLVENGKPVEYGEPLFSIRPR